MKVSYALKRYLEGYVKKGLDIMGMSDWFVTIKFKLDQEVSYSAEVSVVDGSHSAELTLTSAFFEKDDAFHKRWVIAHELVHLSTNGMVQCVEDSFKPFVPEVAWPSLAAVFNTYEETFVDAISGVLAEQFPEWTFAEPVRKKRKQTSTQSSFKKKRKSNSKQKRA